MSVIDWEFLEQYAELDEPGEEPVLKRLIRSFEEKAPKMMSEIDNALGGKDFKNIHHYAHALKNTGGNVGASKFSSLCKNIEDAGTNEDENSARESFKSLQSEYEKALAELKSGKN